ncbi:sigma-54 interaction domain-containing protein [Gemmatimonadota bacterium]
MILSCPTLLFTPGIEMMEALTTQLDASVGYLSHAPGWEMYDQITGQISFGTVVTDYALLTGKDDDLDDQLVEQFLKEALEGSSQARIVVYDVPDEAALKKLITAGVHDVVRAPLSVEELSLRIERANDTYAWISQRNYFVGQSGHIFRLRDIIGESDSMQDVFQQVSKVAASRTPVMISGETGSGKELIAAAIHYNSPRTDQPFIKVNCAALQDTLLESELFGHEKGAFTGAVKQRIGRFEQANCGTLFLDEIGDMSPATQAKVLRVLQSQEFERLGGTRLTRVDVRIIAATNRVLEEEIADGGFREDLYYRLNVVTIQLPPLRERREDIPLLAQFFLKKSQFEERKQVRDFTAEAMSFMQSYAWPGNVRELENTVARAVLLSEGETIELHDLAISRIVGARARGVPAEADYTAQSVMDEEAPGTSLEEIEKKAITDALEQSAWVQSRAALILGISRRALNYRIAKYRITHGSWRVNTPAASEPHITPEETG